MPTHASSCSALVQSSWKIQPQVIARHTYATSIEFQKNTLGWQYLIRCDSPRQYEAFEKALDTIEAYLKRKCFMTILDDGGSTRGKIVLEPCAMDPITSSKWTKSKKKSDTKSNSSSSKDDIIEALRDTIKAKDEVIKTQAGLIAALQK